MADPGRPDDPVLVVIDAGHVLVLAENVLPENVPGLKDALAEGALVGGAVVVVRPQKVAPDGRLVGADNVAEQAHAAARHHRHLGGHQDLQLLSAGGNRTVCKMVEKEEC